VHIQPKNSPDKLRRNAAAFLEDDEHVQALTYATSSLAAGRGTNFAIVATERNIYVIAAHPLGLGTRLYKASNKFPLSGATAKRSDGSIWINDLSLKEVPRWREETAAFVDYIVGAAQKASSRREVTGEA
jgi:hypothetical protein